MGGMQPPSLGDAFVVVLSQDPIVEDDEEAAEKVMRHELQQELAALSTRGRWLVVEGSGHSIGKEQLEVVVSSVLEVVQTVRTYAQAPPG
ncbi:MAG: hypothetical protein ACJATT_002494 [Myxococcota bacterium]|jgi:hypothetical protein